jgi:hypothetical protein
MHKIFLEYFIQKEIVKHLVRFIRNERCQLDLKVNTSRSKDESCTTSCHL